MASARGLLLSSRYEGSPSVLVEALALGTPVASTDCPSGPREILENGRWGRLVAVGDPGGLAEAMIEMLQNSSPSGPGPDDLARYHLDRAVTEYLTLMGLHPPARTTGLTTVNTDRA
jgi:glycosyltransferase involved in cell wall biosynthesis